MKPARILIVLAALATLTGSACHPARAAEPFNAFEEAGIDRKPDARVPLDLAFTDETGKAVTLGELAGHKPIVLAPVLHDCPNICGVTLTGLFQAVKAQAFRPGDDFVLVAFGIDPKEGTAQAAQSLKDLKRRFPDLATTGVHALTGTAESVHAVTDALGYRYAFDERIDQYAHVAAVAVLTGDGKVARWLYGLQPEPTDLKLALTEAGDGEIGGWGDQLLLLCYHYDPETGKYGSIVSTALRIGGGLTVAFGAGFIGLALWREHRGRKRDERDGELDRETGA